jgi:hypothetical protein
LFSPGNSRDDWKILNAIIEVFDFSSFKASTSFDVISFISNCTPFVLYRRNNVYVNPSFLTSPFTYHFFNSFSINNNYYLYDSITRNSKIMSLCYNKFKTKSYNFFK